MKIFEAERNCRINNHFACIKKTVHDYFCDIPGWYTNGRIYQDEGYCSNNVRFIIYEYVMSS